MLSLFCTLHWHNRSASMTIIDGRARPSKKKTYRLLPVILFISIFTINQKTIASFTSITVINGCIARIIYSINWIIRESRCALKFFNRNKFPLFTFCCWFPTVIWLVLGKKRLKSNYFVSWKNFRWKLKVQWIYFF